MTTPAFETLLDAARATHAATSALQEFCAFPGDLTPQDMKPFDIPARKLMVDETAWPDADLHPLAKGFIDAASDAHWRETYKDTDIGADFMDRFACYCLIGPNAPWTSQTMYGFVVYMPAGLWYPWHHHPAEELYFVLAGEGEFLKEGAAPETLRTGQASFHASNQSHALHTHDHPVMAYVLWRNHFDTPPVWSEGSP